MGKIALSLKINVSQIDKARLFKGQKGQYLDMTIFVDLDQLDQYGNSGMITQDVSKDEKQQGVKGNILGNGKVFWVENGQAPRAQNSNGFVQQQQQPQQQQQQAPQQQAPQQQAPQGKFAAQQQAQAAPQQQQNVNPQAPSIDYDDDLDLPF